MHSDPLLLAPGVAVRLMPGESPAGRVFWTLSHVCLGLTPADPQYAAEKHRRTLGSDLLGGDEYRFDVADGRLRSVYLELPVPTLAWSKVAAYARIPLDDPGVLTLDRRKDFDGPIAAHVALDPDGRALVGLYPRERVQRPSRRIPIADGLDLLADGRECSGWVLHDPLAVLVEAGRQPAYDRQPAPAPAGAADLLVRFLALLQAPRFDATGAPNTALRRDLEQLLADIQQLPAGRVRAVLDGSVRHQLHA